MKKLLEAVRFDGMEVVWDYHKRFEGDFKGYYHWHQCCEWMFIHEGKGTIVLNGETYEMEKGLLVLFQPYQLHHIHVDASPEQPYRRSIFYFDPLHAEKLLGRYPSLLGVLHRLLQSRNDTQVVRMGESTPLLEWVYEQYHAARGVSGAVHEEEFTVLLVQLLNHVRSHLSRKAPLIRPLSTRQEHGHFYVKQMMGIIDEHYPEELSLEFLADKLHLSPSYVSRIFKSETGSGVTDYLTARRMREACKLLETTDLSIERIGLETGFANTSYFIQLFKKKVGVTPLKYRNK